MHSFIGLSLIIIGLSPISSFSATLPSPFEPPYDLSSIPLPPSTSSSSAAPPLPPISPPSLRELNSENENQVNRYINDPYAWFVFRLLFGSTVEEAIASAQNVLDRLLSERELVQYVLSYYDR